MLNLTELLFSATPEQIQKAGVCKTADELSAVAKAEGMDITAEQAEEVIKMMNPPSGELSDDELDAVAGGSEKIKKVCPACQKVNFYPAWGMSPKCGNCHYPLG